MVQAIQKVATIASSGSLSGAVDLDLNRMLAIQMPSAWTAADLTFQGSLDGSTFYDLYDENDAEVTVQAAASRFIILEPARLLGIPHVKVRSGTAASPVAQGAERTIILVAM